MKKKIYMSSPALICCAGQNKEELYESCLSGYQGGLAVHEFAGGSFPVGLISGELPEVDLKNAASNYLEKTKLIHIINAALEQLRPTVEKAILKYGSDKIGVCMGSCDIGSEAILLAKNALNDGSHLQFHSASSSVEFISRKFGISGPAFTAATACASGASAIVLAAELIRSGSCGAVIAGGADAVTNTVFAGFHALEAVSDTLTNPFSKNRKGINLGEGAAFFLLESDKISNVEFLGSGESADAYSMTTPGPTGAGPVKAMTNAILDSGIQSDQIGYINCHGTGTELNDIAEAIAMKTVFGDKTPPASSTKPITGHTLGAAGALEAAICWMVLNKRKGLPVHCWDGIMDEKFSFSPVGKSCKDKPSICMSNSFGFGGCNVSLIFGRSDQDFLKKAVLKTKAGRLLM